MRRAEIRKDGTPCQAEMSVGRKIHHRDTEDTEKGWLALRALRKGSSFVSMVSDVVDLDSSDAPHAKRDLTGRSRV
jgi:hypothetical protein